MAEGLVLREQRHLTRRELIYYLKITDRHTGRELGRMGDLHSEGMLFLSETPLRVGQTYEVDLELPRALKQADGRPGIALRCQAVWTRPGPRNSAYHESGVRFLEITPENTDLITRLIDLFAMPEY